MPIRCGAMIVLSSLLRRELERRPDRAQRSESYGVLGRRTEKWTRFSVATDAPARGYGASDQSDALGRLARKGTGALKWMSRTPCAGARSDQAASLSEIT